MPSTVLGGGLRVIFTYANYFVDKGHDVIAVSYTHLHWSETR